MEREVVNLELETAYNITVLIADLSADTDPKLFGAVLTWVFKRAFSQNKKLALRLLEFHPDSLEFDVVSDCFSKALIGGSILFAKRILAQFHNVHIAKWDVPRRLVEELTHRLASGHIDETVILEVLNFVAKTFNFDIRTSAERYFNHMPNARKADLSMLRLLRAELRIDLRIPLAVEITSLSVP